MHWLTDTLLALVLDEVGHRLRAQGGDCGTLPRAQHRSLYHAAPVGSGLPFECHFNDPRIETDALDPKLIEARNSIGAPYGSMPLCQKGPRARFSRPSQKRTRQTLPILFQNLRLADMPQELEETGF